MEQVWLIAKLQRHQLVSHDLGNETGFVCRGLRCAPRQVQTIDQPPSGSIQKIAKIADRSRRDRIRLRGILPR
jgi:hypothetical protein